MLIGNDIIMKILPLTLHPNKQLTFTHNNTSFAIQTKSVYSLLVGTISPTYSMPKLPMQDRPRFMTWFSEQKERYKKQLEECQQKLQTVCSEDPLAFWDKEQYFISLPTITDSNPTKASHTGMNLEDTKLCEQEISELLEKGLIQRTNSPWAYQAFYVNNHNEQKRGKKRLVINYKPLNKVLIDCKYPIPLKDELIRRIKGKAIFSKFDLKSGYWQFKIMKEDRYKIAFIVPQGMYEWITMPMGLKVAVSKFQERIEAIFFPCKEFVLCYIDDILVYSENVEQHIKHLGLFFECVNNAGLALSLKKCTLCTATTEFLGIEISNGMISLQTHVLTKLSEFPNQFVNRKQLQSFTGCLNWIASHYPLIAKDLIAFKTVERSKEFFWTHDMSLAVQNIKQRCQQLQPLQPSQQWHPSNLY